MINVGTIGRRPANFLLSWPSRCCVRGIATMIFGVVHSGGERMRAIAVVAVAGCALLSCARPLAAAEPTVTCALLTPAQIGAATGATIGAGQDDHAEPV